MAERKPPHLDLLVLCSYVEVDGDGIPFSLNEPYHTVLMQPNANGLYVLPELALYSQMTDEDAQGTFSFCIEVRTDTNIVIDEIRRDGFEITFVSRYYPVRPHEHLFVIRGMELPAPGVYHFHVMCGHASMSAKSDAARPAKLRVVPAERPGVVT